MFINFDTIHEPDRHTDIHTLHDGIGRAYAWHRVARQKYDRPCGSVGSESVYCVR